MNSYGAVIQPLNEFSYKQTRKKFSAQDWKDYFNNYKNKIYPKAKLIHIEKIIYDKNKDWKKLTDAWAEEILNSQTNPSRESFSDVYQALEYQEGINGLNIPKNKQFSEYFRLRKDFSRKIWKLIRTTDFNTLKDSKGVYSRQLGYKTPLSFLSAIYSAKKINENFPAFIDITNLWAEDEKWDTGLFTPETVYKLNNKLLQKDGNLTGEQINERILKYLSLKDL
jgi:hypothetical protein